jgi:hypothetical protein
MGNHPAAAADPIGGGGIGENHHFWKKANLKKPSRSQEPTPASDVLPAQGPFWHSSLVFILSGWGIVSGRILSLATI